MARTLKDSTESSGLTDGLKAVLAVDTDGVIRCWTSPGTSTTAAITNSGITTLASQTFGTSAAHAMVSGSVSTDKITLNTAIPVGRTNGGYVSGYAAVVDFDGYTASTMAALLDFSYDTGSASDMLGVTNVPGTGVTEVMVVGTSRGPGAQVWNNNVKFGVGFTLRIKDSSITEPDVLEIFYGAAGGSMALDGTPQTSFNPYSNTHALRAFLNCFVANNRSFTGKSMVVAFWDQMKVSQTKFSTVNAGPLEAFFVGGVAGSRLNKSKEMSGGMQTQGF